MRISNKAIEEVIKEVAGEDVLPLFSLIKNKKNVSEFTISEKLKVSVNVVRNMLYRLYHENLVSFIRKKDKKKGWYIYYWTPNLKRLRFLVNEIKKRKIERLKERIEREKNNFYFSCKNMCVRFSFDKAIEYNYKCPECGELLEQEDNSSKIKELESELKKLSESN